MELLFPIEAPVAKGLLLILGPAKTEGLEGGRRGSIPQLCPRSRLKKMTNLSQLSFFAPFLLALARNQTRVDNFASPYSPHCAVCFAPPANM